VVISTLRILPLAKQRRETLEILRSVQGPTLVHPGCMACRVYAEDGPGQAILLLEEWASAAAFHEHVRSDMYRRILAALDLSSQPPEVCVHHVSTTEGLELIQELRTRCGDAPAVNPATPGHLH
jgi:quinol monooxygenase YgiN